MLYPLGKNSKKPYWGVGGWHPPPPPLFFRGLRGVSIHPLLPSLYVRGLAVSVYHVIPTHFLIHSPSVIFYFERLVIVFAWLITLCVALSFVNRCNEAGYRLIITDAIGFSVIALVFLLYSRIFFFVRRWLRQDLDLSIPESQRFLGSENLSENIRSRKRHIAFSVFLFVDVFALC